MTRLAELDTTNGDSCRAWRNYDEDGWKSFRDFSHKANSMAFNGEGFIVGFVEEHRTLQQKEMTTFLRCIEHLARCFDEGFYDARNEASCRKARIIMDALAAANEPVGSPFI